MGLSNGSLPEKISNIVSELTADRQQNVYDYADKQLKEQKTMLFIYLGLKLGF